MVCPEAAAQLSKATSPATMMLVDLEFMEDLGWMSEDPHCDTVPVIR
jgi:hypothetical protein